MKEVGEKLDSFLHVRVRMQRLPDARFFAGWVRSLSDREILINYLESDTFPAGTQFFMSVNGVHQSALFPAEVMAQTGGIITLRILKEIRYSTPTEQARKQVVGLNGTILLGGTPIHFQVADVSSTGLGGVLEGTITKGSTVDIEVHTKFGLVTAQCEVRYCRQESSESLRHRIGLQIVKMGRIETARWQKMTRE